MKIILCRCEDVTVEDVDHAFEAGHRDIESLKRYTGFGTGYCQGKSCLVPCARRLLELGGDPGQGITPRPPYHPVSFADLAGLARELEPRADLDGLAELDERAPSKQR